MTLDCGEKGAVIKGHFFFWQKNGGCQGTHRDTPVMGDYAGGK